MRLYHNIVTMLCWLTRVHEYIEFNILYLFEESVPTVDNFQFKTVDFMMVVRQPNVELQYGMA